MTTKIGCLTRGMETPYTGRTMTGLLPGKLTLTAALLGATFSVAADDLDSALETQKKKAKRRIYSRPALIEDLNLFIPKGMTEDEKSLDRELKQLESQLDRQAVPMHRISPPRRSTSATTQLSGNWLTPCMMNSEDLAEPLSEGDDSDWIARELERQDGVKMHQKLMAEEDAKLDRARPSNPRGNASKEEDRFNPHETVLRNTLRTELTRSEQKDSRSDSFRTLRPQEGKKTSRADSSSSSATHSYSSVIRPPPFSSLPGRTSVTQPLTRSPMPRKKTGWSPKKQASLSPLKRVRRSSPIHRKNPFEDDFIPEIKTSIWD